MYEKNILLISITILILSCIKEENKGDMKFSLYGTWDRNGIIFFSNDSTILEVISYDTVKIEQLSFNSEIMQLLFIDTPLWFKPPDLNH